MDEQNRYVVKDPNSPATPKQIAFLKYLKQKIPWRLTKGQAAILIEAAKNEGISNDRGDWLSTRRILYPELYYDEDVNELYNTLYSHIRETMKGGSKHLTQKKIISIIDLLDKTQRGWSASSNFKKLFITKLKELYPGCCDEKGQERQQSSRTSSDTQKSMPFVNCPTKQIIVNRSPMSPEKHNNMRVVYTLIWVLLILLLLAGFIKWIIT